MRRINLLPERFMHERERRLARRSRVLFLSVASLCLVGWAGLAWRQVDDLDRQVAAASRQLAPLRDAYEQLRDLEDERNCLQEQLAALEQLRDPVPSGAVLAMLTEVVPERMALRSLIVDIPPVSLSSEPSARGEPGRHPDQPKPIRIQLEGVAPLEVSIADLMRQIEASSIFSNARLDDSRDMVVGDRTCHVFRVSMEVPHRALLLEVLLTTGSMDEP